jgi:esterase
MAARPGLALVRSLMPDRTVNGVRLYYEEQGSGQPILCIHGAASSASVWSGAFESLARHGRVIAYDRRGCTRSERPRPYDTTTVEEQTEDAAALLRALGVESAVVIGRSYGGGVALDLALRHPDLVRAVVSLEAIPRGLDREVDDYLDRLIAQVIEVAERSGPGAAAEALCRTVLGDDVWDGLPGEWRQIFIDNGQAAVAECRGGELEIEHHQLAGIARPILLVTGEDSPPAFRRVARLMAEGIPGARLATVAGGHLISPTDPSVLAFLRDLAGT